MSNFFTNCLRTQKKYGNFALGNQKQALTYSQPALISLYEVLLHIAVSKGKKRLKLLERIPKDAFGIEIV